MNYYKLVYDHENDRNYAFCDEVDNTVVAQYSVSNGEYIDSWEKISFSYDSLEDNILTDFLCNLNCWLVVSEKFRECMNDVISTDVQYLPVTIIDRTRNIEIGGYSVANIISLVDALDLEKSDHTYFSLDDEQILSVMKYALKKERIVGKHIFRLKDDTIPIFVSETVKRKVEENKLLGFRFEEVLVN